MQGCFKTYFSRFSAPFPVLEVCWELKIRWVTLHAWIWAKCEIVPVWFFRLSWPFTKLPTSTILSSWLARCCLYTPGWWFWRDRKDAPSKVVVSAEDLVDLEQSALMMPKKSWDATRHGPPGMPLPPDRQRHEECVSWQNWRVRGMWGRLWFA